MLRKLHHVGVVTADIDQAICHYVETFGCKPPNVVAVDKPGIKLRTAMLAIGSENANYLQLIEPEIGPGVDELAARGEGAIFEMAFEVEDIEAFHDEIAGQGVKPVNLVGEPLETRYIVASSGNRYFYLPKDKMRGTNIEIIQVMPKA
jgi:catechol 2,3-dioxygenase-like lactoylglutathione lyase family enzyme